MVQGNRDSAEGGASTCTRHPGVWDLKDDRIRNIPLRPFTPGPAPSGSILCDSQQLPLNESSAASESDRLHNAELQKLQSKFPTGQDGSLRPAYLTPKDWKSRKYELQRLYLQENKTLKATREIMKQRGFEASEKVYKSRFKRWNFAKYKCAGTTSGSHQVQRKRPFTSKSAVQKPAGEVMVIDTRGLPLQRGLHVSSIRRAPPVVNLRCIKPPCPLFLGELISACLANHTYFPKVRSNEMYHVSSDMNMAHVLFLRGLYKVGGAYCERAFKSIHLLAAPSSNPDLLVFLTTQVMCPNSALTLEAWKYLTGYAAAKSGTTESFRRLFESCNGFIKDHGFGSYLDLVTDRISNELLRHDRYAGDQFPLFPTHYFHTISRELQSKKPSRAYTLVTSFTVALTGNFKNSSSTAEGAFATKNWNNLIELHAVGNETDWKDEEVHRRAKDLLKSSLDSDANGAHFEIPALVAIAAFHRARWDGSRAHSHPRHKLATLYLEKSIDAAVRRGGEHMGSAFLENLEVLETWHQEAGDVYQAMATRLKLQDWVQQYSSLMGFNV